MLLVSLATASQVVTQFCSRARAILVPTNRSWFLCVNAVISLA